MADDVLATARVRIRADGSGLGDDIKSEAGSAAREAGTSSGRDFGQRFGRSAQAALASGRPKLDVDIAKAQERIQQLQAQAEKLGDRRLQIDADITRAREKISSIQSDLERVAETRKPKLDLDILTAKAKIEDLQSKLGPLTREQTIRVDAEVSAATARLSELERQRRGLDSDRIQIRADADVAAATVGLRDLERERARLDSGVTRIRVDAEISQAKARLKELQETAQQSGRGSTLKIDADVAGALAKLAALAAGLAGISALAVGAVGALSGLGAAGLAGTGAAVAGFSGVGDALKAMGDKATAAGASVKVSASAVRSATQAVAQSQRDYRDSLDAVQAAGRGVDAAQRGIADAQRGVETATRAVGAAQRDYEASLRTVAAAQRDQQAAIRGVESAQADYQGSLRAVTDAEKSYQDALRSEEAAQASVNDARREAENQLKDLRLATEDMALSQEDAALSVAEAQARLQEVLSNEKSTSLEKQRAELAVRQAKQREQDLGQSAAELAQKRAAADAKGVEGSDLVRQAQDRLKSSQDSVAAAQQRIVEANKGVADSAQRIVDAQQHVADSQQHVVDANQQAADSQQRIKDAQQGVADAVQRVKDAQQGAADAAKALTKAQENVAVSLQKIQDAQLRLAEAKDPIANTAAATNKLAAAMGKLGPKGQEFATFLRGFIDGPLTKLRQAGQEAFLPGIQEGLQKLEPMLASITPAWTRFSETVGQALGGLVPIIGSLAAPFLNFASASLQGLAPLQGVLQQLATQLGTVFDRMAASGEAQAAMQAVVNVIGALMPLIPPLLEAGAKVITALGPGLTAVISSLAQGIQSSLPSIVFLATTFSSLLEFIAPIAPQLTIAIAGILGLKRIGALAPLVDLATSALSRLRNGAKEADDAVEGAAATAERSGGRFDGLRAGVSRVGAALIASQIASQTFGSSASTSLDVASKALQDYARDGTASSEVTKHLSYDLDTIANSSFGDKLSNGTAKAIEGFTGLGSVMDQSVQHATERLASLDSALASLVAGGKADVAAQAFGRLAEQAKAQDIPIERLKEVLPQYQTALSSTSTTTDTAAAATQRLADAQRQTADAFMSSEQADLRYESALARLGASLATNGATMDIHSEKGRANREALLSVASAANDVIGRMQASGQPIAAVTAAYADQRQKLIASATQMGMTKGAAEAYISRLLQIPSTVNTNVTANIAPANAALIALRNNLMTMSRSVITVPINAGQYGAGLGVYKSAGGWVNKQAAAWGGGPRGRDTVPAWLDPTEFVVRSGPAQRWSGLLEKINAGMPPDLSPVASAGINQTVSVQAAPAAAPPATSGPARLHPDDIAALAGAIGQAVARVGGSVRLDGRVVGAIDSAFGRGFA